MLNDMAVTVAADLVAQEATVAVSESSAGGLISAALLSVPGASVYFVNGGAIYTGPARVALLQMPAKLPPATRSASPAYAQWCAQTVRERLGARWGLAETGAAGPSGNRYGDPAGHSRIAVSGPVDRVITIATQSAYPLMASALGPVGCVDPLLSFNRNLQVSTEPSRSKITGAPSRRAGALARLQAENVLQHAIQATKHR